MPHRPGPERPNRAFELTSQRKNRLREEKEKPPIWQRPHALLHCELGRVPEWFSLPLPVQATADSVELPGVVCLLFLREKVLDLTEDL